MHTQNFKKEKFLPKEPTKRPKPKKPKPKIEKDRDGPGPTDWEYCITIFFFNSVITEKKWRKEKKKKVEIIIIYVRKNLGWKIFGDKMCVITVIGWILKKKQRESMLSKSNLDWLTCAKGKGNHVI